MTSKTKKGKHAARRDPGNLTAKIFPWCLLTLGLVLIVFSAGGDLWLDEVLSMQWARSAKSPLDVLTLFRHDNNHPINTWWLMFVGEGKSSFFYRFLSVISGVLSLGLIWRISMILTPKTAWVPLLLATLSFPLVLYFSEARGYAPASMFLLLTFLLLLKSLKATEYWPHAVGSNFAAILAVLSHGTAIYGLAAMGVWYLVITGEGRGTWPRKILRLGSFFLIPAIFSLAFYKYYLAVMEVAGGPEYSVPHVLSQLFGYSLGLPIGGIHLWITWITFGLLIPGAIFVGTNSVPRIRLFFVLLLFVFSGLGIWGSETGFLYFRYFLVLVPFAYLAAGMLAQWTFASRLPWPRYAFGCFLMVFSIGQGMRLIDHLTLRRGSYVAALSWISEKSPNATTVSSDHDFRTGLVFLFHHSQNKNFEHISYVPNWEKSGSATDWLITHNQDPFPREIPHLITVEGIPYHFEALYSTGPVSGFHWFLYSRSRTDSSTKPQ